jgi:hypothetical protein
VEGIPRELALKRNEELGWRVGPNSVLIHDQSFHQPNDRGFTGADRPRPQSEDSREIMNSSASSASLQLGQNDAMAVHMVALHDQPAVLLYT